MVATLGFGAFFGIIGFGLGLLSTKFRACATHRTFPESLKPKDTYQVSRVTAITYLMEIEKQELEIRQNGFRHVATINLGALALSGGLLASSTSTLLIHVFASVLYIIALIFTLIAIWLVADQRKKRLEEILKNITLDPGDIVEIPYKRMASPVSSRILIMIVYALLIGGIFFTMTSFVIPNKCESAAPSGYQDQFMCSLVRGSINLTKDKKEPACHYRAKSPTDRQGFVCSRRNCPDP